MIIISNSKQQEIMIKKYSLCFHEIKSIPVNHNRRISSFWLSTIKHWSCNKILLWWFHLLLTSNKLHSRLIASTIDFSSGGKDWEVAFVCLYSRTLVLVWTFFFFSRVANSLNKLFNTFNSCFWNFTWNTNSVWKPEFYFYIETFFKEL